MSAEDPKLEKIYLSILIQLTFASTIDELPI